MSFIIDFEPIGTRVTSQRGETILNAAQRAGVMLTAVCGGTGQCGRCLVRVMSGNISPVSEMEGNALDADQLREGWRFACRIEVDSDVRIFIPPESLVTSQRIQLEGQSPPIELDPAVNACDVELPPPTLDDPRPDTSRLRDQLRCPDLSCDLRVLRQMPADLRANEYRATAFLKGRSLVALRPARTAPLGLAMDLGTTKLAAYLVDVTTGRTLAATGAMNPQIAFGEDVMARIGHAVSHPEGQEQLRNVIIETMNRLARDLCAQEGRKIGDIAEAVVVGNTAMHHLFLGLPVRQLGVAPFVAVESAALDLPARDVGLEIATGASVYLLPNIAAFVGGDHVAMLLAAGFPGAERTLLGIDIGTNTEISLMAKGRHYTCSTASGPAFEGAHIRCGMRAAPGAIEEVLLVNDEVLIKTIEDRIPAGLCGSGILDLIAELRRTGILNSLGTMDLSIGHPRLRRGKQGPEFIVVPSSPDGGPEITVSRGDVSQVQLAKGAIRSGINILLQNAAISESEIDEIVIAGAFGTYLSIQSAIDIGMFPRLERSRFKQAGNAAGTGARLALLSMTQRDRAVKLARDAEYIELTTQKNFSSIFTKSLFLQSGVQAVNPSGIAHACNQDFG